MTPLLVVVSSPSGAGKTTLVERLLTHRADVGRSVSATTRAPRNGEVDGRDYHFLAPGEFANRETAGEFLETATYGGHRYGTLRAEVERLFRAGKHVLMVIEVAGARQVRRQYPEAVTVFVLPPSVPVLVRRLSGRMTESREALRHRLEIADQELEAAAEYDYVLENDDLDRAVRSLGAVLDAEPLRIGRRGDIRRQVEALQEQLRAEAARLKQG
ncbi:MAG TPA: guanylate kinase [Gemmatimonadales bacterium]|nr:guanylate kinase [Gemmatimonadales bacterium]